jgi:hypothetical protein
MRRSAAAAAASITLAFALCPEWAAAAVPQIDVSGFGTGGFAITDTGKADFGRSQAQATGTNKDGDVGISLFGIQGTVRLTDMFSATVQGLVRRQFSANFQLDIPVFFLKAEVTRDLAVRVGRIQLPTFMVSDYRQVGYSNTWIRPPVEMYGQIPFDNDDGADVLYRKSLGPFDISTQVFYGKTDASLAVATIQGRRNWGVDTTITIGPLSVRGGRSESTFTSISTQTNTLLAEVSAAGFPDLANRLSPTNVPFRFTNIGFSLDGTHLTAEGEASREKAGGYLASLDAQYVLAGYRVRKFTPYVMYARSKITSERTDPTIPHFGPLLPLALGVDQLINSFGGDQHTISAGLRWDLHDSVDMKAQVDRVSPQGNGLFVNPQPGFHGPVDVLTVTVDFVF